MSKLNSVDPTTFPTSPELNATNSGIGLLQLPPGHKNVGPNIQNQNMATAAAGAVFNNGIPGEFHKSTRIESNWLKSGKFGVK